jgi:hypothetical protein
MIIIFYLTIPIRRSLLSLHQFHITLLLPSTIDLSKLIHDFLPNFHRIEDTPFHLLYLLLCQTRNLACFMPPFLLLRLLQEYLFHYLISVTA